MGGWSWGVGWSWGCMVPGGLHGCGRGVHGPGGVWYPIMHWGRLPPVNGMTNRCKNITLPQASFAGSNKRRMFVQIEKTTTQECIRVGCVPSALYRTGYGLYSGVSVQRVSVRRSLSRGSLSLSRRPPHPVDRQMPVKILPCPTLRLRAVINEQDKFMGSLFLSLSVLYPLQLPFI